MIWFWWLPLLKQRTKRRASSPSSCNFEIWCNVSSSADAFFPVRTRGWDLTVQFTVRDCSWVTHAPGLTPGYKMRPLHAMRVPKSYPASSTRTNKDYLHFRCIFYDRWQDFKITRGIHHNLLSFLYISYILKVILEKRKPGDLKREIHEPLVWLRCPLSSAEAPPGYPYKNNNNRKIDSARGKMGRGKSLFLSFPFPSCPALSFFLSPQPPYTTKRPLRRREYAAGNAKQVALGP